MIIEKTSPFSGNVNRMSIQVTQAQIDAWKGGELIQNAMPNVSADEREFIKTGITPEEWENTFGAWQESNFRISLEDDRMHTTTTYPHQRGTTQRINLALVLE